MTPIDVSVVVCTYNRAEMLREALASLRQLQLDREFEIVVVDNASTDHTQRVIEQAAAGAPVPIRGFRETKQGVSCARNRGIAEAHGQWIAFFDDDQVAEPDWLEQLLAMAQAKSSRCVGGAVLLQLPAETIGRLSPECRGVLGENSRQDEFRYSRRVSPGTGNLLVHRSVLDEVGTFDAALLEGGEDTDLFRRIRLAGIEAWYTPQAVVRHAVPAYRLEEAYFLWAAERIGWAIARREHREWQAWAFPLVLAARFVQAALLVAPRYLLTRLVGGRRERLGATCRWRESLGHLRGGVCLAAPAWFSQSRILSRLDFRSERQTFAGQDRSVSTTA